MLSNGNTTTTSTDAAIPRMVRTQEEAHGSKSKMVATKSFPLLQHLTAEVSGLFSKAVTAVTLSMSPKERFLLFFPKIMVGPRCHIHPL